VQGPPTVPHAAVVVVIPVGHGPVIDDGQLQPLAPAVQVLPVNCQTNPPPDSTDPYEHVPEQATGVQAPPAAPHAADPVAPEDVGHGPVIEDGQLQLVAPGVHVFVDNDQT